VYGSTQQDVALCRHKVTVAARLAAALGRPDAVEPIAGDVREEDVARRLAAVDVLMGCTDSHWSRLVLNRIAVQYLIPLIDLGTRIDGRDGTMQSIARRVSVLLPGSPCLMCSGIVRSDALHAEALSIEERHRQAAEGYVQGLDETAPSVVSLNTVVAGLAVTELLKLVTAWGNVASDQLAYNALDGTTRHVAYAASPACRCQDPAVRAAGDAATLPIRRDHAEGRKVGGHRLPADL
jgi:molybdopterin/thiamine biosynthesis adenylyltransferase